tara:strand:+ start:1292 stop:3715 length:2424 start_codon:yes stop_codon:yes gene_type:complete
MIYTNSNSSFPDQVVPDVEKQSLEYGKLVGQAIEYEWFGNNNNGSYNRYGSRFSTYYNDFHQRRLYARGEQSVQKYKDELSINGDLSYLNLDWKPVPVIPKFVDIVVNGMSDKAYDIKAYAQDPVSIKKRTDYAEMLHRNILQKQYFEQVQASMGMDISNVPNPEQSPLTEDELSVHMQLDYKQAVEIAEEEVISDVLDRNKHDLIKRRYNYDLTVIGIGATKTCFNKSEGIKIEYKDPANLVWSYTEDPNFEDIYYVGEVQSITIPELVKRFPHLTPEQIEKIQKYPGNNNYTRNWNGRDDNNTVQVLFFEYKTYTNQTWKIKETPYGLEKALEKQDTFNPPEADGFKKVDRTIEVLYTGAKILGFDDMLEWKMSENMTRPFANNVKVNMNYNICAPRMYKGRIESLVSRMMSFADMIQITHLKLQQILNRMVPDGVFLDADGIAEVDLGNGTNYNPAEALNMYFQTGSIVGRSMTQDGDLNHGKVPIQELQTSASGAKIQALIQTYQYYLQMIRDVTGLNEARDGSMPDADALVGLQKLAAANSNTATRHILQGSLFLTLRTCENITLRIADCLQFPLLREALRSSISRFNVHTLDELSSLNLHDFGIFLELEPDEEERQLIENNIQVALQSGQIYLEDAIDIREVKNLKLANQLLKQRRTKKLKQDQEAQQANIQAQAQANAEQAERAAMSEVQKQEALAQTTLQVEKGKSQFAIEKLQQEAEIKKQLMELEFQFNMQLAQVESKAKLENEKTKEDRKDERTKIQATQQSELIDQRNNNSLPKNFESSGNDVLGGFGLGEFDPS